MAVTHRSSAPYKRMRASIANDNILADTNIDLTFRVPAGVGFLSKSTSIDLLTPESFVVFSEYYTKGGKYSSSLLENVEIVAKTLRNEPEVLSYWALKWQNPESDKSILVFERYTSRKAYLAISSIERDMRYVILA